MADDLPSWHAEPAVHPDYPDFDLDFGPRLGAKLARSQLILATRNSSALSQRPDKFNQI